MLFPSWANFLCSHDGADGMSKSILDLKGRFQHHLKGEEAIICMGITSARSPLFLYHIIDLESTRRDPEPSNIALVMLKKGTAVVGITTGDCF
jgi:hypothetical protein